MNLKSVLVAGALAACTYATANAETASTVKASEDSCTMLNMTTGTPTAAKKAQRAANRELAHRVREQLSHTQGLENTSIVVFAMADTGKIVLAGLIQEANQDQIASDAAKQVQGVSAVNSQMTIREEGS
ncbi:BON domain-containing protein [Trinickia dinghuensis]|uniref:BON domain-containing protein n=1 Tax=Trinickia dinghuensis TaxID=2291023 RepID=A0A3D8K6J0_9BURK|nr:BON domain-containing protein [Trinickia dinghuensis]RDV00495.1 BON domain-containing protein [Trinickia dinghuensis]